jgi:hypothetical protein
MYAPIPINHTAASAAIVRAGAGLLQKDPDVALYARGTGDGGVSAAVGEFVDGAEGVAGVAACCRHFGDSVGSSMYRLMG